jgi:AcrR family transcriptional regulator
MVYRQTARSEKIRQESRKRILEAARKLFVHKGYEATTMQQIVREAGTSIGNAYFYFENKEKLVKALVEEGLQAAWTRIDPIIASVEPGPLRIAVNVYANTLTLLGPEKDLAAIAMASMPGVIRHITQIMWERLSVLFSENFPERDPEEVLMISAAVFGANRTALELCLTGILKLRAEELANFLVAWHLRALKLPERQINRSVRLAARACKTLHGKAPTSSR